MRDITVVRFRRQIYTLQAIVLGVLCIICLLVPLNVMYHILCSLTLNQLEILDDNSRSRYDRVVANMDAMAHSRYWNEIVGKYLESTAIAERADNETAILQELKTFAQNNPMASTPIIITPIAYFHSTSAVPYQAPDGIQSRMNPDIRLNAARQIFTEKIGVSGKYSADYRIVVSPIGDRAYLAALVYYNTLYDNDNDLCTLVLSDGNQLCYISNDAKCYEQSVRDDMGMFFHRKDFGRLPVSIFDAHLYTLDTGLLWAMEYFHEGFRYLTFMSVGQMLQELQNTFWKTCLMSLASFAFMLMPLKLACQWAFSPFDILIESINGTHYEFTGAYKRLRNKRQLQLRFFICYCLILVTPIALTPFIFTQYQPVLQYRIKQTHIASAQQQSEVIEDWANHAVTNAKRISADMNIQELMHDLEGMDEPSAWDGSGALQDSSYVRLYNQAGELMFSTQATDKLIKKPALSEMAVSSKGGCPLPYLAMDTYNPKLCSLFCAVCGTKNSSGYPLPDSTGYMEFGLTSFPRLVMPSDGYSYMYDIDAWALVGTSKYTPLRNMVEGLLQSENWRLSERVSSRTIQVDYNRLEMASAEQLDHVYPPHNEGGRERFLVTFVRLNDMPWVYVALNSTRSIDNMVFETLHTVLQAAGIMTLVLLVLSLLFTYRMLKPLRKIETYLLMAESTPVPPDELLPNNEFSALAYAFARALHEIQELHQSVMEREREKLVLINRKTEAEIVTLHSQLNSHLFSNVFASMQLLLQAGDLNMLERMLSASGSFLRNGLVSGQLDVTLAQEIEHTRAYITLQMLRYGDQLRVDMPSIQQEFEHAIVPQYLLQPIIENAVIHGMTVDRALNIGIHCSLEEKVLCIKIRNDGLLISQESIDCINNHLAQKKASAKHIGLINIQERIQLRYGRAYGLNIENEDTGHVRVLIRLPFLTD